MGFKFRQRQLADPLAQENFEQLEALGPGQAVGAFRAWLGATTAVGHGSRIPFGVVEEDVSGWYDEVNAVFVPQVAGIYRFSWHAIGPTSGLPNGYYFYTALRKNGTSAGEREGQLVNNSTASGSAQPRSTGTCLWRADGTTDYFGVIAYNATGAAINITGGDAGYTYFEAELVGRAS